MSSIWWEKHRPMVLRQFVGQSHLIPEFENIIDERQPMQHYIFNSTEAGTGKTTLAYIIAQSLGYTIHHYNASSKRTRGIEFIEDELIPLAQSGLNEVIILLDEADQLTLAAQSALKGVIEGSSCYFILTCNDLSKISRWLQSRCSVRHFKPHTVDSALKTMRDILNSESMTLTDDDMTNLARIHEGDLRNTIGALQTLCYLDDEEGKKFLLEMGEGFDARRYLRLATTEKSVADAVKLSGNMNMRSVVRRVFDYATNSPADAKMIAKVVECAIISERDIVMGVDESVVRWDFARMLSI